MAKVKPDMSTFVRPLNINGLDGRMLRVAPPKNKTAEILLVYGHHASLERMFGFAEAASKYAGVTMPDLPGFGGMQSFYKIRKKPTLDAYADYLAAFIKWRYKNKKITVCAVSFGFVIVTKMLQKYPELQHKVTNVIAFVGFTHKDDFAISRSVKIGGRMMAWTFSRRLPAFMAKNFVLRGPFIRVAFNSLGMSQAKLSDAESSEEKKRRIDFEVNLWKCNDIRTHMYTLGTMLTVDVCDTSIKKVNLHYIGVANDHYFDKHRVEQHARVVYPHSVFVTTPLTAHAPTVIADGNEVAQLLPAKTRQLLRSLK